MRDLLRRRGRIERKVEVRRRTRRLPPPSNHDPMRVCLVEADVRPLEALLNEEGEKGLDDVDIVAVVDVHARILSFLLIEDLECALKTAAAHALLRLREVRPARGQVHGSALDLHEVLFAMIRHRRWKCPGNEKETKGSRTVVQ